MPLPILPRETERCCTPTMAWRWCKELAAGALAGDDDFRASLPEAINHYLEAEREGWARPLEGVR